MEGTLLVDNISEAINLTTSLVHITFFENILKTLIGLLGGVAGIYIILTVMKWYEFRKMKSMIEELKEEIREMKKLIKEERDVVEDIKKINKVKVVEDEEKDLHKKRR